MKVEFWMVGKTNRNYINEGIKFYEKRIVNYSSFVINEIKIPKVRSSSDIIKTECRIVLDQINPGDHLILLDEKGEKFSSREFAAKLEKLFVHVQKKMIFIAGGPYGFCDELYRRANEKISLSKLTFTHEMARIIFLEQYYRALTIINNHPYQH